MKLTVRHLVAAHQVAVIDVTTDAGRNHRIGHLYGDGWFCNCSKGKRCSHINEVLPYVPDFKPLEATA